MRIEDGHFRATMEWGTQVRGRYEHVVAPELIVMSWDFADEQVPVGMSRAFPAGTLVEIPGAGHFDLIDPESRAWP